MCQEFPKEKWIDAQKENVLDAPYYHVVFTVPEELNMQRKLKSRQRPRQTGEISLFAGLIILPRPALTAYNWGLQGT